MYQISAKEAEEDPCFLPKGEEWVYQSCSAFKKLQFCFYPMQETWVQSLGQEDPLEKGMATHSSILAWRIPWTE